MSPTPAVFSIFTTWKKSSPSKKSQIDWTPAAPMPITPKGGLAAGGGAPVGRGADDGFTCAPERGPAAGALCAPTGDAAEELAGVPILGGTDETGCAPGRGAADGPGCAARTGVADGLAGVPM